MAWPGGSPLLGHLEDTGDSLLEHWQLRAHFTGPFVEHHSHFSDPSRDIRNQHEVKQWVKVKKLGEGGGGKVYLQEERGGAERAVKKVGRKTSGKDVLEYLREILAMAKFSKEAAYFIQLFGWYSNESHIFIAMEYIRYGSLHDCVKHPLPESEARTITQQVVEALEILHRKNWAHRDLKPSNVFVIRMGPSWWVKLGDFGVSKSVANEMTQYRTYLETDFTAPEIIGFSGAGPAEASGYTNAADLWSLGFFVHWMLTLRLPLTRPEMGAFCSGALPQLPQQHLQQQSVTEEGIDIILSLLKPQPSQRPNAHHIREHKWLQDVAIMSLPMQSNTYPEQYRGDSPDEAAHEHKVPPYMDYHAQHSRTVFPSALNPSDSPQRSYGAHYTPYLRPYNPLHVSFGSFPQASRAPDGATHDLSKTRTRSYPSQGEASKTLTSSYNADPNPESQIPMKGKNIMIVDPTTMKDYPLSEFSPSGPPSATEATPDPHTQRGTVAVKTNERRLEATQGTVAQEAAAKTNLSWAPSEQKQEDVAGRKAAQKTIGSKERHDSASLGLSKVLPTAQTSLDLNAAEGVTEGTERKEEQKELNHILGTPKSANRIPQLQAPEQAKSHSLLGQLADRQADEQKILKEVAEKTLTDALSSHSRKTPVEQPNREGGVSREISRLFGSEIEVITRSDGIRYKGVLADVNAALSTLSLSNAKSFGTETRDVQFYRAPAIRITESLVLSGTDVLRLRITGLSVNNGDFQVPWPPKATLAAKPTTATTSQMAAMGDAGNSILDHPKQFANSERLRFQNQRCTQALLDRASKLEDLLRFSQSFKLKTPIPNDLVGILATDPIKQQQIIEKARRDVEGTKNTITDQNSDDDQASVPGRAQRRSTKQQVTKQDQTAAVGQQTKHTVTRLARPDRRDIRDSSRAQVAAERSRRMDNFTSHSLRMPPLNATAAAAAEKDASLNQKRQPRQKKKWIKVPLMLTANFNEPVKP